MKILLLAAGNDIHSVRWANQLTEHGNEVHLCYVSNHKPAIDKLNHKVYLHELKFKAFSGYYLNLFQLRKIIKSIEPDILNAHYSSGYGTLARFANFSPYILSVYGSDVYDFPYKSVLNMSVIKKNLLAADAIASTSNAMARQTASLVNIPLEDIHITPFGVDTRKFKKEKVNNDKNQFVIGSIKKLAPKYGMKYGILAIDHLVKKLIKDNTTNIKYYIYGEGEEKAELVELVKERGLEDIIEFKGRIPNTEVPESLNKLDIFLGSSVLDSESFGVAIVEAMACEVPVIVTDVDGFKEVVDNGNAGIIVPRKNHEIMASEILNLIEGSELRKALGVKGRKRVNDEYIWSNNVKNMESIYKQLIDDK